MTDRVTGLAGLVGLVLIAAGCASALGEGRTALRQGDYRAATRHFEEALSQHPDEIAARFGLGIARYRLGDLEAAIEALTRVVIAAPRTRDAHLYLGLSALKRGDQRCAGLRLEAFRDLGPPPRSVTLTERALLLISAGSLPAEVRDFIAASLENEVEWEREVREARLAPRAYFEPTWAVYGDGPGGYPYGWFLYFPRMHHAP